MMFDFFRRARCFALVVLCCGHGFACTAETPEVHESVSVEPVEVSDEADDLDNVDTVDDVDDPWLRRGQVAEWTGDLDGMIERGFIRMLTPANRTDYFVDGAVERGIIAEYANALEEFVNRGRDARDPVRVVVLPVQPDQLLPMLTEGLGDVAGGELTVTPERREIVDFSPPFVTDIRELVVTGPGVDPVVSRSR